MCGCAGLRWRAVGRAGYRTNFVRRDPGNAPAKPRSLRSRRADVGLSAAPGPISNCRRHRQATARGVAETGPARRRSSKKIKRNNGTTRVRNFARRPLGFHKVHPPRINVSSHTRAFPRARPRRWTSADLHTSRATCHQGDAPSAIEAPPAANRLPAQSTYRGDSFTSHRRAIVPR